MRPNTMSSRFSARGFTLIELLVTVAVAAVLLAVAAPNLRESILASQARQTARAARDAFDYARQYALNTATVTTIRFNGCGYEVTAGGSSTTLTRSAGISGWAVSCSGPAAGAVSFLGDGTPVTCTGSGAAVSCQPLGASQSFSVTGGNTTWQVTLFPSGLTTTQSNP